MKTWLEWCAGFGWPFLRLIVGLVCLAAPSVQADPAPVVLQQGVQPLWSHMSVMAEPMSRPNPEEAQAWFESHQPLTLSHEQAQVGSWEPQPRWARLVIRNEEGRPRTKVLVHPSTTQRSNSYRLGRPARTRAKPMCGVCTAGRPRATCAAR